MSAIVTLAGRRVGVKSLYNPGEDGKSAVGDQMSWRSDELEIRCGFENQHLAEWAPRIPVEQPRRTGKKRCYGR